MYQMKMEEERERREKADAECLDGRKRLNGVLGEIEDGMHQDLRVEDAAILADRAAKVGQAMASLRTSMGGMEFGFGYGMGCYGGMSGETEEA